MAREESRERGLTLLKGGLSLPPVCRVVEV